MDSLQKRQEESSASQTFLPASKRLEREKLNEYLLRVQIFWYAVSQLILRISRTEHCKQQKYHDLPLMVASLCENHCKFLER